MIRQVLSEYPDGAKIPVQEFADKVKVQLLPLKPSTSQVIDSSGSTTKESWNKSWVPEHEGIVLPDNERGLIQHYFERIYESPIKTSAGKVHFDADGGKYFAHTRIEDLPGKNKVRRIIELQSDLFQKGRFDREATKVKVESSFVDRMSRAEKIKLGKLDAMIAKTQFNSGMREVYDAVSKKRDKLIEELTKKYDAQAYIKQFDKLRPYENTWHERIIREEIKQAAKDGKTKLQFPTGETAMKIEGLGEAHPWMGFRGNPSSSTYGERAFRIRPQDLKVGRDIYRGDIDGEEDLDGWVITDILGDGKFKAVPKFQLDKKKSMGYKNPNMEQWKETFDISGKVNTNNPIYRFYEKEVARYLRRIAPDLKLIKDKHGVTWFEINVPKEKGSSAIEAFGAAATPVTLAPKIKEQISKVENYGKQEGDWAQLEQVVIDDLQEQGILEKDITLEQVKKDPELYDRVVALYLKRMDDFGIPDDEKALWWLMPGRYKRTGGDVDKLKNPKHRNIMNNRIKNLNAKPTLIKGRQK